MNSEGPLEIEWSASEKTSRYRGWHGCLHAACERKKSLHQGGISRPAKLQV